MIMNLICIMFRSPDRSHTLLYHSGITARQAARNYQVNLEEVVGSIQINSVVIEKLIDELALLTNAQEINSPAYKSIDPCPADYSTNNFFSKYIKTFLAPIYMQRAMNIESRSGKPFVKQWAFTADNIIKDAGIILNANQVYYYGRSEHDEFLLGFSSKISEVYRSAFLRVLRHFLIR